MLAGWPPQTAASAFAFTPQGKNTKNPGQGVGTTGPSNFPSASASAPCFEKSSDVSVSKCPSTKPAPQNVPRRNPRLVPARSSLVQPPELQQRFLLFRVSSKSQIPGSVNPPTSTPLRCVGEFPRRRSPATKPFRNSNGALVLSRGSRDEIHEELRARSSTKRSSSLSLVVGYRVL